MDVYERVAIRQNTVEEVAKNYHDALAEFWEEQGRNESLAGVAEDYYARAKVHRTYAQEIREQVWLDDDWNKIETGKSA